MSLPAGDDADTLGRRLDEVADRLRHLPASRLAPVAGQLRRHVQGLATLSLRAAGRPDRALPVLADSALGDQVAVVGHDLVAALQDRPDDALLAQGFAVLADLRRCLPSALHGQGRV